MTEKDVNGMIWLYQDEEPSEGMAKRLPSVTVDNGKTYYIDERLRQLRNIACPYDFIQFSSKPEMYYYIEQHETNETEIIVLCPQCDKVLFKGNQEEVKRLIVYCVDCVSG